MMKKIKKTTKEKVLTNLLSGKAGKKYQGKQVVILDGQVYILPEDGQESADFVDELIKKHPKSRPTITYVPCRGTYILLFKV